MNYQSATKEEIIKELLELQYENNSLRESCNQEISNLRQSLVDLRENRMLFKVIFEDSLIGVALTDSITGRIFEVNSMFAKIAGRTRKDLCNIDWKSITHPEDIQSDMDKMSLLDSGDINGFQMEKRYIRPDGTIVWINMAISKLINPDDISPHHLCMIEDITERKKTEEALQSKTSLLEAQISATSEGILVVDEFRKKILINKRIIDLLDMPPDIAAESDALVFLNYIAGQTKNPEQFIEKEIALFDHMSEVSKEEIEFRNGMILERFCTPVLGEDERNFGRIWTFRDITEQKKAELGIILKNNELQKAYAEKDKFFSIIAHDLRSPFSGLLGLTDIMADDSEEMSVEEIKELSKHLNITAHNTFNLLEDLLEWAKMERGLIEFKPGIILLRNAVAESLYILGETARRKSIEIVIDIQNQEVHADSHMLQTVLRNLTSNAIKYTNRGGKVSISCVASDNHNLLISVKDSGIGMRADMMESIFKIGSNTKRLGTEGEHSNGLGLLLCKEFVEKQGGEIWVESEEGKGSTFYFTVPAKV